jgi:cleavage and polyadenylation specificity factor subunit 1
VTGKTEQEHLKNLDNVLSRMQRFGLRANLNKCYFFKENVTYCGYEIGSDGLKKSQDKIDAILKVKKLFRLTGHDHIIEYTLDTF